jgi:hypothetical protein
MKYTVFVTHGVFNKLDALTAVRFMGTGAPLAAERMRILPMTQLADKIWNERKFYLCSQITDCIENAILCTCRYFPQSIVSLKKHR